MPDPIPPRNSAMAVAASALQAQQSRMRVIAENIANAQSTSPVAGGQPYRRQIPVFQAREINGATGVALAEVRIDQGDFLGGGHNDGSREFDGLNNRQLNKYKNIAGANCFNLFVQY